MGIFRRHPCFVRGVGLLVVGLLLIWATGLIPSAHRLAQWSGRMLVERYPCEGHSCGCHSAESCWAECCCLAPAQKLAWAIANKVAVPPHLSFSEQEWSAARSIVYSKSCCTSSRESVPIGPNGSAQGCKRTRAAPALFALTLTVPRAGSDLALFVPEQPRPPRMKRMRCAARSLETPTPPPRSA